MKELSIDKLREDLKKKEELKTTLENNYYQVLGQIQLLIDQITFLEEKKEEPQKPE